MRVPIKLNSDLTISKLLPFLRATGNPANVIRTEDENISVGDYLSSVSSIKFGSTFKSTGEHRHLISRQVLKKHLPPRPIILDIGASTGTTSLELMEFLGYDFDAYFVTDHNLEIEYARDAKERIFFYSEAGDCILIGGKFLVYYPKEFSLIEKFFAADISRNGIETESVMLIDPRLRTISQTRPNITVAKYSIFDPWPLQSPNVIIVGNLMNRTYFSDEQLSSAISNLNSVCLEDGYILIIENRESEQGGLYQKRGGKFHMVEQIGHGSDIHELIV